MFKTISPETREILKTLGGRAIEDIPKELVSSLTGKGLTVRQAEALLDCAKDLLKDAKI